MRRVTDGPPTRARTWAAGTTKTEVVVVGSGPDGSALAWRLGELGIETLVLEAGPFHGNERWPSPHDGVGHRTADDPDSLSGALLDAQFSAREGEMNNPVDGTLRWGPADRSRPPWTRLVSGGTSIWQLAGVGGTSLHYLGNHPRAYPSAVDEQGEWPIAYADLVPYYQYLEAELPVHPAPTAPKEALFYHGAREVGYDLLTGLNVTEAGYRPFPNAILPPDERLADTYDGDYRYPDVTGDTLSGHELQGGPHPRGAPVEQRARRSANVALIPRALRTGNVTVRPNAFAVDVLTVGSPGSLSATGVRFRDTWSGALRRVSADVVVLAAGCIETPRLWLNSGLPANEWVGRGLTTHWFDFLAGVFDADTLEETIGQPTVDPYVGQNAAARVDLPGVGALALNAFSPGMTAVSAYANSRAGYWFETDSSDEPWDSHGRIVGRRLKELMADYERTLTVIVHTDDRPHRENGVGVDHTTVDEHGPVARVEWEPSPEDDGRREELVRQAARLLRAAGASHVHRADPGPILLHMQTTMPMGKVTDEACEAREVDRLFVADHSVLPNGLGGANPTHTGQALALRTAEQIAERYFEPPESPIGTAELTR